MGAHQIDVEVDGVTIERWQRYSIITDMLAPADNFDLTIAPLDYDMFLHLQPDAEIVVRVDGIDIITGYIDDRLPSGGRDGATISINGRDKGGRLVDESMPLQSFKGLRTLQRLALAAVSPWFTTVTFSNADNRTLLRGRRGRKVSAYGEPAVVFDTRKAPKKVEPGESRWTVLENWLEPAELLGWSTADGSKFVIGLPNYNQETQFQFIARPPGSTKPSNVISWELADSIAERYSQITVVGSSRGSSSNYGSNVTKHKGVAADGPGVDGIGSDFARRKTLIITDGEVKSAKDALDRASREMSLRDATGRKLRLTVDGHGQRYTAGTPPTLYCCDTMAQVTIPELHISDRYLIVSCQFSCGRDDAELTTLTLVPDQTVLTQ